MATHGFAGNVTPIGRASALDGAPLAQRQQFYWTTKYFEQAWANLQKAASQAIRSRFPNAFEHSAPRVEHFPSVLAAQSLGYTRFDNWLVQFRTTSTGQREYTYDQLNRLTAEIESLPGNSTQTTLYGYDSIGSITSRGATSFTYTSARPHHLQEVGQNAYTYDANGNVESRVGPDVPGLAQTFEYTPFDLPRAIHTGAGSGAVSLPSLPTRMRQSA